MSKRTEEKMIKNNKKKKVKITLGIIFTVFAVLFLLLTLFSKQIFGENSWLAERSKNLDDIAKAFMDNAPKIFDTLLYVAVVYVISKVIRTLMHLCQKKMKRGGAVINLFDSFIKYVGFIVIIIIVLKACGVNTSALITSIGVLGLTLGLGAQSLIEDIISGLFIVFERTFDVGDVIVFDGFRGRVIELGLRTTRLVDIGGDILIVNNSDLRKIINMTNEYSYAICDVSIEYGADLKYIEKVLYKNFDRMKQNIPDIIEGPYYRGVNELGESSVVIRIVAQCDENDRFQVVRDMNREILLIFAENGITIPFNQLDVHMKDDKEIKKEKVEVKPTIKKEIKPVVEKKTVNNDVKKTVKKVTKTKDEK